MDRDGDWLDVGCANGFLLATLPTWCAERGVTVEPYGLELLPAVAHLARLGDLVERLLNVFVEPRGRLIVGAYSHSDAVPRDLFGDLTGRLPLRDARGDDVAMVASCSVVWIELRSVEHRSGTPVSEERS